jgi:hypothetical protein
MRDFDSREAGGLSQQPRDARGGVAQQDGNQFAAAVTRGSGHGDTHGSLGGGRTRLLFGDTAIENSFQSGSAPSLARKNIYARKV